MQRRFSFDSYLGMVLFALLCTCLLGAAVILLGPQIDDCFCGVEPVKSAPNTVWVCCRQEPEPGLLRVYPILFIVLLGISVLVAVAGIVLGRTRRARMDVHLLYTLELCPFLTLIFLGVVGSIVYLYADLFLLR
jgi:hypothetical protein